MKILVADDSKAIHALIRGIFAETSVDLVHVYDGMEACNQLRSENFDLVLLDWEMPQLDGHAAALEMRKFSKIPIIMVTTKNKIEDVEKMIAAGVDEYVMKPYTSDILFEKIESVIGKKVA